MVFSNQRNWNLTFTVFFKRQGLRRTIHRFFSRVDSIRNKSFFLSLCQDMKEKWLRNGKIRSCNLLCWYLLWCWSYRMRIFRVIWSCWISVSVSFYCCSNWLRSGFSLRDNWLEASIPRWCCDRERFFSSWVCYD